MRPFKEHTCECAAGRLPVRHVGGIYVELERDSERRGREYVCRACRRSGDLTGKRGSVTSDKSTFVDSSVEEQMRGCTNIFTWNWALIQGPSHDSAILLSI